MFAGQEKKVIEINSLCLPLALCCWQSWMKSSAWR